MRTLIPMPDAQNDLSLAIFNALDTGLILVDGDQRIVAWNSWISVACGIDTEDAVGKTLKELFRESKLQRLESAIASAFDSGVSSLLTHSLHPNMFPLR